MPPQTVDIHTVDTVLSSPDLHSMRFFLTLNYLVLKTCIVNPAVFMLNSHRLCPFLSISSCSTCPSLRPTSCCIIASQSGLQSCVVLLLLTNRTVIGSWSNYSSSWLTPVQVIRFPVFRLSTSLIDSNAEESIGGWRGDVTDQGQTSWAVCNDALWEVSSVALRVPSVL